MIKWRYVLLLPIWAYVCFAYTLGAWLPREMSLAWAVARVGIPRHIPYYEAYLPTLTGKSPFFPSVYPVSIQVAEEMGHQQPQKRISLASIGDNRQYQSHLIQVRSQVHIVLPAILTKQIKRLGDGVHFLHMSKDYQLKPITIQEAMASANYIKAKIDNGQVILLVKKPLRHQTRRDYEYWLNGNIRYITENTLNAKGQRLGQQVTAFTRNGKNLYTLQTNQHGELIFKTQYVHDSSDLFAKTVWWDRDQHQIQQLTWRKDNVFRHQYFDQNGQPYNTKRMPLAQGNLAPLAEERPYSLLQTVWH